MAAAAESRLRDTAPAESVPVMMKLMKFSLSCRRRGAGPYGLIVALPNIDPHYNIAPTMTIGGRDPA
jgi:hypothetical protein